MGGSPSGHLRNQRKKDSFTGSKTPVLPNCEDNTTAFSIAVSGKTDHIFRDRGWESSSAFTRAGSSTTGIREERTRGRLLTGVCKVRSWERTSLSSGCWISGISFLILMSPAHLTRALHYECGSAT
ncbi:restriction endonuclease [Striga asiatica]|uniref:Restriction endonuclease n=1 Tax=Striga asiatica TaxID=4170 RepID=A0A5A7QVG0_STRAF|nr:restriction endonuclease [Striga asiatica]